MKRIILIFVSAIVAVSTFAINKSTYAFAEKDGQTLKLDVYMPEDTLKEHPCLVFAFGGGFKMGARDEASYQKFLTEMAENGIVGVSIDYRLGLKDKKIKNLIQLAKILENSVNMAVEDMASAVEFVLKNAADLKVNPKQIMLSGSSAGAITALQTDYYLCNAKIKNLPEDFRFAGVLSFAGAVASFGEKLEYKKQPAPVLFMHGTKDGLVAYDKKVVLKRGMYGSNYLIENIWVKNNWPYMALRFRNFGHEVAMIGFKENVPTILEFIDKFVLNQNKIYVTDVTIAEQGVNEPLLQLGTDGLYGDAEVIVSDEVIERIK
jgi:dipeptidyl aminopeptidase/acylaminoacyl peptidase